MSHQAYGPLIGVKRILDMLDRHGMRSTFFVPGFTADRYPGVVRDIASAGHDIAHHGYNHIRPTQLSLEGQADQLDRGIESLERLTGSRPVGYRAPMWDLSWEMPALLEERGFLYESSLMDGDEPYFLGTNPDNLEGGPSIIEIPIHWALDDWEQYCYIPGISELGPIQTPRNAVELWTSELDGIRERGGCWVLTNHPFLSGRPGRARALEALLEQVVSMPEVWVAALDDIAKHVETLPFTPRSVKPVPESI